MHNLIKTIHEIASRVNAKFRFTENARASGGGERLAIKDWQTAKNSKDFMLSHVQRYEWVYPNIKGLRCLDVGCGCGYGTGYLAKNNADSIIGVDISADAIKFAKKYHKSENLEFFAMDALNLKFKNNSFDAIICFEMIEHIPEKDQYRLLEESIRVLKDNGTLYISCPNAPIHKGSYPFHYKEFTMAEFKQLLSKFYKNVDISGQDLIINGTRQGDNWRKYLTNLSYNNFIITQDNIEFCYGLLAICKIKSN